MRIHLSTSANNELVPFNYQQKLLGVLHRWLGTNELHDKISLYSFSWLKGGKRYKNGLHFPYGANWFISFCEEKYVKAIINAIMDSPDMFCGMKVERIVIQETPDLSTQNHFQLGSPIFIKRFCDGNHKHFTYKDENTGEMMAETLRRKMQIAGLPEDPSLKIEFDLSYPNKKEKLITIHNISNKCSMCPLIIEGTPLTKAFAWNCGIGSLTGSGCGSII
jgi:CRISPR-associated endoribonuclease Cas6